MTNKRKGTLQLVCFLGILLLVLVMLYSGLRILESTVLSSGTQETEPMTSKTVTRDGVDYFPRQDITVILAMGIDEHGPVASSGSYRNDGEADALILLILDQADRTYSLLCLNRDTMTQMPALGLGGKPAGSYFGQLALSHTFGEGLQDSCENTVAAVEQLLDGISIDYYVSLHMDGIGLLNDAVGGVTVHVTEDFSQVDPSIPMGQVTLNADQALTFVRSRVDVGNQLNISRMGRHEQYMEGLMTSLSQKLEESDSFAADLFTALEGYIVTDCSANTLSGLLSRCADYTFKEVVSPEGQNVLGEQFFEFYPDEEKLDALVLRLFYAEK